jgi:hypothetical protein
MRDVVQTQPLFVDAIEIPARLEADRSTPYDERVHRDRTIAISIRSTDPLAKVREWDQRILKDAQAAGDASIARRLVRARRLISLSMLVLGALAGVAVSSAVFRYDGTWPVNVVTVLATLVLLQMLLAAFTLVMMAPRVPGLSMIQELLGGFNPGALAGAFYRRLRGMDDTRAELLVWHEARGPTAARFARWQMIAWSQLAAVAFNVAALATAAGLIAFTDLAFGWSTTLQVSSADAARIADALSTPWRQLWPAAAPSVELIETSRFFRLTSSPPNEVPAARLTGWWPFLLAAILTYALLPRCVLLIIASLRLHAATRHLLLDDPRVTALLDRMRSTEIQLGAAEAEHVEAARPLHSAGAAPSGAEAIGIVWSGAIAKESVGQWSETHLKRSVADVVQAGGGALDGDQPAIERAARSADKIILIFVRAWEAPLLDLKDFLSTLRERVGVDRSIVIVPVAENRERASETERAVWSRWTARAGDTSMYVESGA